MGRLRAVLLDAYGTLVTLEPPAPRLRAALSAEGHEHPEERVAAAIAAEIAFYREHHDEGRDAASLGELRRACARVLGDALGPDRPPLDRLTGLLLDSLEFVLLPDAVPALDALAAGGMRLAVASNWDCSLPAELARLGVADRFDVIGVSALVGARKPSPGLFHHVLERLGVGGDEALHCGDQPGPDCLGAAQAGVRGVLVDRAGRYPEAPCPRVGSLLELPALVARAG